MLNLVVADKASGGTGLNEDTTREILKMHTKSVQQMRDRVATDLVDENGVVAVDDAGYKSSIESIEKYDDEIRKILADRNKTKMLIATISEQSIASKYAAYEAIPGLINTEWLTGPLRETLINVIGHPNDIGQVHKTNVILNQLLNKNKSGANANDETIGSGIVSGFFNMVKGLFTVKTDVDAAEITVALDSVPGPEFLGELIKQNDGLLPQTILDSIDRIPTLAKVFNKDEYRALYKSDPKTYGPILEQLQINHGANIMAISVQATKKMTRIEYGPNDMDAEFPILYSRADDKWSSFTEDQQQNMAAFAGAMLAHARDVPYIWQDLGFSHPVHYVNYMMNGESKAELERMTQDPQDNGATP